MRASSALGSALVLVLAIGCQTAAAPGTGCTRSSDCAAPLVCRIGRCRSECRTQRDCPLGARCLLDADGNGACSVDTDVCADSAGCNGLACIDGRCENACETLVQCAPGSRCEAVSGGRTRCVRDDSPDAAVFPDAGRGVCAHRHTATALASALDHTCAIRDDGVVVCWGLDTSAELGDGSLGRLEHEACGTDDCAPVAVAVLDASGQPLHATHLAVGAHTSCAVEATTHALVCWGDPMLRGTQPGTMLGRASAVLDDAGHAIDGATSPIHALAIGAVAAYVLHDDGSVQGWGDGTAGQLGVDPTTFALPELSGGAEMSITAGGRIACALGSGQVRCIGTASDSTFGTVVPIDTRTPTPVTVTDLAGASMIAGGPLHLCGAVDGSAHCIGNDLEEELGNTIGATMCNCWPTAIVPAGDLVGAGTVVAISASPFSPTSCARTASDVYCWGGLDEAGQIGPTPSAFSVHIAGLVPGVVDVAVGRRHACAILTGGIVMCWGGNERGQLGIGIADGDPHPTASATCVDLPTD